MEISQLFDVANGPGFKYYPHFITLYTVLILASVGLRFYRKRLDKNQRLQKKVSRNAASTFAWIGVWGFFFLFCRYAYVIYLSAEILHVLLILGTLAAIAYYAWRLKVGYPSNKKSS